MIATESSPLSVLLEPGIMDEVCTALGMMPVPESCEASLRAELQHRYLTLLSGPRSALMSALYRFDIAEADAHAALRLPGLPEQAARLSALTLHRAAEKVRTRRTLAARFSVR